MQNIKQSSLVQLDTIAFLIGGGIKQVSIRGYKMVLIIANTLDRHCMNNGYIMSACLTVDMRISRNLQADRKGKAVQHKDGYQSQSQ